MINEEEFLKSKIGRRNPFTVPEGYFDQLTQQVMAKIPEQTEAKHRNEEKPARIATFRRLRPWLYAAACVCIGVFIAAIAFNNKSEQTMAQQQQMAATQQEEINSNGDYSDYYLEEAADYAMIDNQEIYACLLADM